MHPLVRGAASAAVLTALASAAEAPAVQPTEAPATAVVGVDGLPAPCGPGTLPEGPVCVRIPGEGEIGRASLAPLANDTAGPDLARSAVGLDRIPRRPDRPADPGAYLYPVGDAARPPRLLGGLDGDAPPVHGWTEQAGVHLAVRPGEKIVLLELAHQRGPAEVVLAGELFGPTVVTLHEIDEGGRTLRYLLFHGRLDRVDPAAPKGAKPTAGATLGFARSESGGGLIEIYLEARLVREGAKVDEAKLTDASVAVPIDLRDVLPLR